jgi:hypothetical protein
MCWSSSAEAISNYHVRRGRKGACPTALLRPDASAAHGIALPQRIRMEGHVRTEGIQQLVALSSEICCALFYRMDPPVPSAKYRQEEGNTEWSSPPHPGFFEHKTA